MTRTEMIREIANQANCSKRLVRKKLFELSARTKKDHIFRRFNFNQAFLNKATNWRDHDKLIDSWRSGDKSENPWKTPNLFEVTFFPSGCVVLLYTQCFDDDGYHYVDYCGTRLYNY